MKNPDFVDVLETEEKEETKERAETKELLRSEIAITNIELEEPADNRKFQVLINIDDVFTYINKPEKPLLLTDEVDKSKAS